MENNEVLKLLNEIEKELKEEWVFDIKHYKIIKEYLNVEFSKNKNFILNIDLYKNKIKTLNNLLLHSKNPSSINIIEELEKDKINNTENNIYVEVEPKIETLQDLKILKKKKKSWFKFLGIHNLKRRLSKHKLNQLFNYYIDNKINFQSEKELERLQTYIYYLDLLEELPDKKEINDSFKYGIEKLKKITLDIEKELNNRFELADISEIEKYFYEARKMDREIICYLGPTNSGKTHAAVAELKKSKKGLFLSPLRLLANEVYQELKDKGYKCNLFTGDKIIYDENNTHSSSTIEMANLKEEYDVAIIDEIQFLSNRDRGSSWVRSLLGLKAKKIFLIGSLNAESQIRKIMDKIPNDKLTFNYKERLSEIILEKEIMQHSELVNGDCVILFSKNKIYQYKNYLEGIGKNVNIIYGDLPYDVKIKQSNEFNKGNSILLSTDAIGYGLNLSIRRIIYTKVHKFYNKTQHFLSLMEFQQISGRAGRFNKHEMGYVRYMSEPEELKSYNLNGNKEDYSFYKNLVDKYEDTQELKYSYFFPELEHLLQLYENIDEEGKKTLKNKNNEISLKKLLKFYSIYFKDKNKIFQLVNTDSFNNNITIIENIKGNEKITLENKYLLSFAPISFNRENNMLTIEEQMFSEIVDHIILNKKLLFEDFYDILNEDIVIYYMEIIKDFREIDMLIEYYKNIKLFLWCGLRFDILKNKELAEDKIIELENKIQLELEQNNKIIP